MRKLETLKFALPLAFIASLGGIACTSAENGGNAPASEYGSCEPGFFTSVNVIGAAKEGGINAKNSGACGAIYDPVKVQRLGEIASDEAFILICTETPERNTVVVAYNGVTGNVDVSPALANLQVLSPLSGVPACEGESV